ncbi:MULTISPECIES: hypothetical protein [unclassified Streptomyces]|uniref:hypothetical protein n=1 Tax=unclassified Streptomyces TaxID=2593676 RepID=UPI002DD9FD2B|nr:hypothetical protein [Streptomyces sp. NBC_01445]WSE11287.1 hypothetical protein OG574_49460 [Streptomyces sp. NBC_01445]
MKASTTEAPVTDTGPREGLKLRAVVSGSIGNLLEQYDNVADVVARVWHGRDHPGRIRTCDTRF